MRLKRDEVGLRLESSRVDPIGWYAKSIAVSRTCQLRWKEIISRVSPVASAIPAEDVIEDVTFAGRPRVIVPLTRQP